MGRTTDSPILSVPSWVIPGTYAENLRFLENKEEIDGVELLFYFYDDEIKNLLDSEWNEIKSYAKRFVFTAHLPDPLLPVHDELIIRLVPFVKHFIIHPAKVNLAAQAALLAEWAGKHNAKFLAENTNPGMIEALLPHLAETDAGLCMDTGHLLMEDKNPACFFKDRYAQINEIHLHAVNREQAAIDGKLPDHRSLQKNDPWLHDLLPMLENYRGVINFEVFSWDEAKDSISVFNNHKKQRK